MDEQREENIFSVDEVSRVVKESIEDIVGGQSYKDTLITAWNQKIIDNILTNLTKEQKPFKYIVNSIIMQKNGAGLHGGSSCFWNNDTDGTCTVRWENKTMYCIVAVFGLGV